MARSSVLLWAGTVFSIVGLVFLMTGIQEAVTERAYRTDGLAVEATVLDKSIERAKRGENTRTRYLVAYRFTSSEGDEMESSAEVSVDEWERLEKGQRFPVTYLPAAPESNRLQGGEKGMEIYLFLGMGGLFALIGGGMAYFDLRVIVRTLRLVQHGLPTQGTVTRVGPTSTSINRVTQWRLWYSYRDHLGREQQGASHLLSPVEASVWHEGDTGVVRFDRARPNDSVWIGQLRS
jgi:hypothetical protein